MPARSINGPGILCGAVGSFCVLAALGAEPSERETENGQGNRASASQPEVAASDRVPVGVARDRAKVMHEVYVATLHMMHERYFHGERAMVLARAMQDVFAEIKRQSQAEARWISVNLKPMSIDHEPKSDFEKRAARELASGQAELEIVEDGYYRRAGAISLGGGCISCHAGFFTDASTAKRLAGLVISLPVTSDSGKPE